MNPTFGAVYEALQRKGPGRAVSTRGTVYRIEARDRKIFAFPRSSQVIVHEGCWGQNTTCEGTRAGGIYNGPYSIIDWFLEHR
jgi:hypothetical protein